ncbi:hypothetical protein [Streptacidiphilus sp. EB129]|uniref:hypothetical protein n=1 Tax=Streptacidiphilus sp. EB129 TaxID=3156262 RepID=UPI003514A623
MRTARTIGPVWMPQPNTVACLPAGRWWDAIVVPQLQGLDALEILDHESGRAPGPVIWEPAARLPRLYFLVPTGTADTWTAPDTQALGTATFVVVPGPTSIEPPGVHWLVPPDPDEPDGLVDAGRLAEVLGELRLAAAS